MVFNSSTFAVFFLIVYALYLVLDHKWQNRMLLAASCVFYGAWNWKFLFLLFLTMIIDFNVAVWLDRTKEPRKRKLLLAVSVISNLSIIGFFKYFNFFVINFQELLLKFGIPADIHTLNIVLPVGISFYTFQAMSYTIDVYRKELHASKNFTEFALFVTFFPQLVAGPIERATHLLPQVQKTRRLRWDWIYEGLYLILFGLFQKMFVADNLAKIVNPIFAQAGPYNGAEVLLGTYAFAFQIFCDFAGYSNMARGLARLMGFDVMVNFNLPYFATNPSDFWQRWHISLSRWLRDYLYVPLGGNRKGKLITYRNLILTMLLGGLWHGAAWTFIIWGAYHGLLLVLHRLTEPYLSKIFNFKDEMAIRWWKIIRIVFFFHLVCVGWLFFRARSLEQALMMINSLFTNFHLSPTLKNSFNEITLYLALLLLLQIYEYQKKDLLAVFRLKPAVQICLYLIMFYSILLLGVTTSEEFIYFQF